jgi:hypothetical protein
MRVFNARARIDEDVGTRNKFRRTAFAPLSLQAYTESMRTGHELHLQVRPRDVETIISIPGASSRITPVRRPTRPIAAGSLGVAPVNRPGSGSFVAAAVDQARSSPRLSALCKRLISALKNTRLNRS